MIIQEVKSNSGIITD